MNETLIAKLEKWMSDEPDISKLEVNSPEDKLSKYIIEVTYRSYPIDIVFSPERIDSFIIRGTVSLDSEHIFSQIERFDSSLRRQLKFDMQHEFSQYSAEFRTTYDEDNVLKAIHFSRVLWDDGLNKNMFFKGLIDIVVSKVRSINYINKMLN